MSLSRTMNEADTGHPWEMGSMERHEKQSITEETLAFFVLTMAISSGTRVFTPGTLLGDARQQMCVKKNAKQV